MRTKFTKEETADVYIEEVIHSLVEDFKLTPELAKELLVKSGFRERFLEDISSFNTIEPSKVAWQHVNK